MAEGNVGDSVSLRRLCTEFTSRSHRLVVAEEDAEVPEPIWEIAR
jgi:hypothetical protein